MSEEAFTGERYLPAMSGPMRYEHVHRYEFARALVAGKNVLDVACGEGYGCELLAGAARHVTGLDIDAPTIEAARVTYPRESLEFGVGACNSLPFGDGTFDVVTSFETIEHVDDYAGMLDEIGRVLAPDGILIISSPNKRVYAALLENDNPFHVHEFQVDELAGLLRARFRSVELFGQRIAGISLISRVLDSENATPALSSLAAARAVDDATYVIAVCGAEPRAWVFPAAYHDASDDLWGGVRAELRRTALGLADLQREYSKLEDGYRRLQTAHADLVSAYRALEAHHAKMTAGDAGSQ